MGAKVQGSGEIVAWKCRGRGQRWHGGARVGAAAAWGCRRSGAAAAKSAQERGDWHACAAVGTNPSTEKQSTCRQIPREASGHRTTPRVS